MHAISVAGTPDDKIIGDKRGGVRLQSTDDIAVAGYVDNFGVLGCNPCKVNAELEKVSRVLRDWGLTVHEVEEVRRDDDFVGLHFDGRSGFVSIKPARLHKIRSAIVELLQQQQIIIGHCAWAMMSRREALSIIRASDAFINQNLGKTARLWSNVRRELQWIASLLPIFRFKINTGWSCDVSASDSSPWGVGVCHRQGNSELVRSIGACSEKWRYRF